MEQRRETSEEPVVAKAAAASDTHTLGSESKFGSYIDKSVVVSVHVRQMARQRETNLWHTCIKSQSFFHGLKVLMTVQDKKVLRIVELFQKGYARAVEEKKT